MIVSVIKSKNVIRLVLLFLIIGCSKENSSINYVNAFRLSIEKNIQSTHMSKFIDYDQVMDFNIYVLPLNKELINATIEYKCWKDKLDLNKKKQLIKKSYNKYIHGNTSAFALIIKCDNAAGLFPKFNNFNANTYLWDESDKFQLQRYTRIFDVEINDGWTKGFLYFENFRKSYHHDTYSIHIANINLGGTDFPLNYSYEETEINFLSLLQKGIDKEQLRNTYIKTNSSNSKLNASDWLNITSILVTLISMI